MNVSSSSINVSSFYIYIYYNEYMGIGLVPIEKSKLAGNEETRKKTSGSVHSRYFLGQILFFIF